MRSNLLTTYKIYYIKLREKIKHRLSLSQFENLHSDKFDLNKSYTISFGIQQFKCSLQYCKALNFTYGECEL